MTSDALKTYCKFRERPCQFSINYSNCSTIIYNMQFRRNNTVIYGSISIHSELMNCWILIQSVRRFLEYTYTSAVWFYNLRASRDAIVVFSFIPLWPLAVDAMQHHAVQANWQRVQVHIKPSRNWVRTSKFSTWGCHTHGVYLFLAHHVYACHYLGPRPISTWHTKYALC